MAQKTNPTSLRLKFNRKFDSSWWSSLYYSRVFERDLSLRKYFKNLLKQTKKRSLTRIGYTAGPKDQKVFLYWAKPKKVEKKYTPSFWRRRHQNAEKVERNTIHLFPSRNSSLFQLSSTSMDPSLKKKARTLRILGLISSCTHISPDVKKKYYNELLNILLKENTFSSSCGLFSDLELQEAFKYLKKQKGSQKKNQKKDLVDNEEGKKKLIRSIRKSLRNSLQTNIRRSFKVKSLISPSIMRTSFFSAQALSDFIKDNLKKRISHGRIFALIKAESRQIFQSNDIKGIRILVSGRLGRPEKARKASLFLGRSSLNSFNEQIDYSSDSALTRYGLVGIKVWISF